MTVLLALGVSSPAFASQPRSNYALTVLLDQPHTPELGLVLQMDQITGDSSFTYWAENMTANVSLGPQLGWTLDGDPGGSEGQYQNNVSGTTHFNFTAYIAPATRQNLTNEPNTTVFASFTATVVYTDNLGANPRTITRTVSFALNYIPPGYVSPPPPPFISLLPAALLGVGGAGTVGAILYVRRRARLEELYLMHDSGMLIRHWSRASGSLHDSDIMSGMLIVLQEFVRDTWKSHGDEDAPLEQLRFGAQRVVLARGAHSVLAAVVYGRYLNGLPLRLTNAVQEFERSNADRLADWNGNVDVFPKVDLIAQQFLGNHSRSAA